MSWREAAVCRTVDPELFFPRVGAEGKLDVLAARAICRSCSVAAECLEWALSVGDRHAVLGGTTAQERELMRRAS